MSVVNGKVGKGCHLFGLIHSRTGRVRSVSFKKTFRKFVCFNSCEFASTLCSSCSICLNTTLFAGNFFFIPDPMSVVRTDAKSMNIFFLRAIKIPAQCRLAGFGLHEQSSARHDRNVQTAKLCCLVRHVVPLCDVDNMALIVVNLKRKKKNIYHCAFYLTSLVQHM